MSTNAPALGSRENWWWENRKPIEDLRETPINELNAPEMRRVIEDETTFNLATEHMPDSELRAYLRDLRADDDRPTEAITTYEYASWKAHQELRKRTDKVSGTAKYDTPCLPGGRVQQGFAWLFEDEPHVELLEHDPLAVHSERCEVELTDPEEHIPREYNGDQFATSEYGQHRFRSRYDPEHGYMNCVAFREHPTHRFMEIVEDVLLDLKAKHHFRQRKLEEWLDYASELKGTPNHSDQQALTQVLLRIFLNTDD